jgi:hypothetical protein
MIAIPEFSKEEADLIEKIYKRDAANLETARKNLETAKREFEYWEKCAHDSSVLNIRISLTRK